MLEVEKCQEQIGSEQATLQRMEAEKAGQIGPELKNLEKALKQLQGEQAKMESERDDKEVASSSLAYK